MSNWSPEERAYAQRTAQDQVDREVEAFLWDWTYDQPFQPQDLANAISNPKYDVSVAVQILRELKEQDRVHHASGGWNPGPLPPTSPIDQA